MSNDRASQAREGLVDGIAGKAKEFVGAVTDKDDLVQEGQLQQEESRNRKEAVAEEAIADAKREEATDSYRKVTHEAADLKDEARAEADREKSEADRQRAKERQAAEREAALNEAAGKEAAEERADDLAASRLDEADKAEAEAEVTEMRADAESIRLEQEAAADEQHAAQLRAQSEK